MIGLWRRLRNLDRIDVLTTELRHSSLDQSALKQACDQLERNFERERDKRIAAEALNVERLHYLEALHDEIRNLREQNERILNDRLHSLDAINTKLLEPRVEPPPPDFQRERELRESAGVATARHLITGVREFNRQIDMQLLGKFHPSAVRTKRPEAVVVNEEQNQAQVQSDNQIA